MDARTRAELISDFETVLASKDPTRLWALVSTTYPTLLAALDAVTAERDQAMAALTARGADLQRLLIALDTIASGEHRNPAFAQHCGCMSLYAREVLATRTPDPAEAGGAVE